MVGLFIDVIVSGADLCIYITKEFIISLFLGRSHNVSSLFIWGSGKLSTSSSFLYIFSLQYLLAICECSTIEVV